MVGLGCLQLNDLRGVDTDAIQAVELYELAIEKGQNVRAKCYLARRLQCGGEGVRRDAGRAVKLFERAVEQHGDVEAMVENSDMRVRGAEGCRATRPVPRDFTSARSGCGKIATLC